MSLLLSQLTPKEQATLKLCGITRDTHLARASATDLSEDVQKCRDFFPEQTCDISLATLQALCAAAAQKTEEETPDDLYTKASAQPDSNKEDSPFQRISPTLNVAKRRHSHVPGSIVARPLSANHHDTDHTQQLSPHTRPAPNRNERSGELAAYEYQNAVHCTHSIATYLGAWATLLFIVDIAAIITIPILMLLGFDIKIDIRSTGLVIAIGCALPYLLLNKHAICSVCRIRIYSFRKYAHNRQAHWMPLMGCSLPTALHVIFCHWFRCPACGTPQKLFHRSARR